jgi:hypothetical protein
MTNQATLNDNENQNADRNRAVLPEKEGAFEHPAQALRRILGHERFKSEHVYGVTARRA